jgi:hypothetical protein
MDGLVDGFGGVAVQSEDKLLFMHTHNTTRKCTSRPDSLEVARPGVQDAAVVHVGNARALQLAADGRLLVDVQHDDLVGGLVMGLVTGDCVMRVCL